MNNSISFSVFCIDFRFDAMIADYFKAIGQDQNYFACTVAGGALALGYKRYCMHNCPQDTCDKNNLDMKLFKINLLKNLEIAMSLKNIETIYLTNHQDCGAAKKYLTCDNYPEKNADVNKEILINQDLLVYANECIKAKYPNLECILQLIDLDGTIAKFHIENQEWEIVYVNENVQSSSGFWNRYLSGDNVAYS